MRYQSSPFIPQERQETTRERAERQRQERRAELTYTESDEKRWAENRERVLRERQQAADSAKNTPEDELILKSSLKQSKSLNDLAAGKFNALKKGSTNTEEIKKVQQALIDCGFDLGAFGADGDFGRATEGAVKQFQTHYKPTHTTHKSYQFGDIDGIVGKNTILALDEAAKEGWKFVGDKITCDPEEFFYSKILIHEGGFVNHPKDPGGATNKGVIIDTWKQYSEKLFGIKPSVESLKEMTDEQAYRIFLEGYWKKSLANKINNCAIAFQFVDFYYNAPQGAAVVLQRTINALGGSVAEDWHMGPSSLKALNEMIKLGKEKDIYITFRTKRVEYYNHRADTIEGASFFRDGWVARAESFKEY